MNKALLWKDFGLLKDTIVVAVALLGFSYVLAGVLVYMDGQGEFAWSKAIAGGASLARFTSVLICALIGGHLYGREREEHSDGFLDHLPARRLDVMFSKLLVSATVMALVWIFSMAILVLGFMSMGHGLETNLRVLLAMLGFFASGVAVFGAALLASFFVASAIGASFVGLMLLVPILAYQTAMNWAFNLESGLFFHWSTILFMLALGAGNVVASFRLYVRGINGHDDVASSLYTSWCRSVKRNSVESKGMENVAKATALGAILWKDFQLMKAPLILGAIVMALPYAIGVAGSALLESPAEYFRGASLICIAFGVIVFTFWAGQMTTIEHTARSIEFSSYLPIPRRLSIASKLLVTLCPAVAIVTVNAVCLVMSNNLLSGEPQFDMHFTWDDWNQNGYIVMGPALANGTLAAYSLAWFLGTRYGRPAMAIVSGIIVVPLCLTVWASISSVVSQTDDGIAPVTFVALFSAGTVLLAASGIAAGVLLEYRNKQSLRSNLLKR